MSWRPIATYFDRPRHGPEVLVYVECATVPIVRLAWWDDGSLWEHQGCKGPDEARGWWSYDNSVTQARLDGPLEPTHWMPAPALPGRPAHRDLPGGDGAMEGFEAAVLAAIRGIDEKLDRALATLDDAGHAGLATTLALQADEHADRGWRLLLTLLEQHRQLARRVGRLEERARDADEG